MNSRIPTLQNTCRRVATSTAFAVAGLLLAQSAGASELLTAETEFFSGSISQTVVVDAPSAGTVTVTLADLGWPTKLQSLSFFGSTEASVLQSLPTSTPTQYTYSLTGPMAFYAHLSADAGSLPFPGLPDFGLLAMQVNFTPTASAVPLPGSFFLLVSGLLAGVAWLTRRTRSAPAEVPAAVPA